jgi:hypothetical protein
MAKQPLAGASEKLSAALGAGDTDQGDPSFPEHRPIRISSPAF